MNMKRLLIVVDYQNDLYAEVLVWQGKRAWKRHFRKIAEYQNDEIIYTLDTHFDDYLTTAEGKSLPVPHCIKGTVGHKLYGGLADALKRQAMFWKKYIPVAWNGKVSWGQRLRYNRALRTCEQHMRTFKCRYGKIGLSEYRNNCRLLSYRRGRRRKCIKNRLTLWKVYS